MVYSTFELVLLGRFHLLSDFDEGKRSCRRKLERHNRRRRRKPRDSTEVVDKDPQGELLSEDAARDGATEKGSWSSNFFKFV